MCRIMWPIKPKEFLWGEFASLTNHTTTNMLKDIAGRTRPSGTDNSSFPSGHAPTAGVRSTLACRNIDYLPLSNLTKLGLKTRVGTLAVGTAWARVEADVHYPSDVLTGLALGHFIAAFFNEAFLMPKKNDHFCFGAQTSIDKIVLTFYWAF